jgi:RhtB (resistance to homoserine/threonine) family protein
MQYLPIILTVAAIHLLAVMSPGPDFIMIMRNSLVYSRRTGVYSALGLSLGILLHVSYCLLGIAVVISRSIMLFNVIKFIGAGYLIYIGYKSLFAGRGQTIKVDENERKPDLSAGQAIRTGFITNATNPKATLFFLSLFTIVIQPGTPLWVKLIMAFEMMLVTFLWFAMMASVISHRAVRGRVAKVQHWATRLMGGALILFGFKLATAHSK